MEFWNDRVSITKAVSFTMSINVSDSVLDKIRSHNDLKTL